MTGGTAVIVDVLRFSTAVEAAVTSGAAVYPYRGPAEAAPAFAASVRARLADSRDPAAPGLSPASLAALGPGSALVLPSPNGSTCSAIAAETGALVLAGCLRNALAVAAQASQASASVTVIACGERWPDGSLRPALEDLLGAGAILSALPGDPSPEAAAAIAAFRDAAARLPYVLAACASGRELAERGRQADVAYAAALNVSTTVPALTAGAFRSLTGG